MQPADGFGWLSAAHAVLHSGAGDLLAWEAGLAPGVGACCVFAALTLWAATGLPGVSVLILAVGAVYGLWWGTLIVSLASTVGATMAFLAARHGLRERLRRRHAVQLERLDQLFVQRGPWVLLLLRLAPAIPFPLLNPLMGLTSIRIAPFFLWSWIGMLGGTLLWVWVGEGLARAGLAVLGDLRVWAVLAGLVVLGALSRAWAGRLSTPSADGSGA
jgi:uncharacterized membrane protein YdjX (TVP38/TMEM64 family)